MSLKSSSSDSAGAHRGKLLPVIAGFKLIKAALLFVAAFSILSLIHKDAGEAFAKLVNTFHADPDNRFIEAVMGKLINASDKQLAAWSAGTFFYALLFTVEGTGLALRKGWAEYLTVVITISFIPLELFEVVKRCSAVKIAVLIVNILIALYLIAEIRRRKHAKVS